MSRTFDLKILDQISAKYKYNYLVGWKIIDSLSKIIKIDIV